MLNDLLAIGFKHIGRWELVRESIGASLTEMSTVSPALYAFVIDGKIKYVGKTSRTLAQRLYGYAKGGSTQRTNIRVRALILESLKQGLKVEIYGFCDRQPEQIGRFLLDKSAGLEDDIIKQLQPEWNGRGNGSGLKAFDESSGESLASSLNKSHISSDTALAARPSSISSMPEFTCKIGTTYFAQGFFNVPVSFSKYFGGHGAAILIEAEGAQRPFDAKINRTVNVSSGAPRIMGGVSLKNWFQDNLSEGDVILVSVIRPDFIKLSKQ